MPKRRKRHIPWTPLVWSLAVLTAGAGLIASPLTALRVVRVEGVHPANREYVRRLVQHLRGRPAQQIDRTKVAADVLRTSSLANAEFRCNVFGRGTLKVSYRKPVARVAGASYLYVDAQGGVFRDVRTHGVLPMIKFPRENLSPRFGLGFGVPMARLAECAANLDRTTFGEGPTVEIRADGAVSLWVARDRAAIRLGAPDHMEAKLRKFREMLRDDPELLSKVAVLNLTNPSRPTIIERS